MHEPHFNVPILGAYLRANMLVGKLLLGKTVNLTISLSTKGAYTRVWLTVYIVFHLKTQNGLNSVCKYISMNIMINRKKEKTSIHYFQN